MPSDSLSETPSGILATKESEIAYGRLRDMIVSLELKPNEPIDEKQLTTALQIGRTPIREALFRLELEKLVVILPRRGTYVAPIDLSALRELEQLRFNLEAFASSLAASNADESTVATLRELVAEARASEGGRGVSVEIDRRFHKLIADASKNRYLKDFLENLNNLAMRTRNALGAEDHPVSEELADYESMLKAIEARDSESAAEVMRLHLRDSFQRLTQALNDVADF